MSMTDPIADMLTRIRNACKAKLKRVDIPASKLKREIARVLLEQKFIKNYKYIDDDKQGILRVYLKYTSYEESIITGLKRVSKPGCRIYVKADKVPAVLNGLGVGVISTSKGVLTDKQARRLKVGGEVLCFVW